MEVIDQFDLDRRVLETLDMLGRALIKHDHDWTQNERRAYDWSVAALKKDLDALAA